MKYSATIKDLDTGAWQGAQMESPMDEPIATTVRRIVAAIMGPDASYIPSHADPMYGQLDGRRVRLMVSPPHEPVPRKPSQARARLSR